MIRRMLTAAAAVLALAACDAAPTAARAAEAGPSFNSSPLTVGIIGPTDVTKYQSCIWLADAQGGVPPYQFRWRTAFTTSSWQSNIDFTFAFTRTFDFVEVTVKDSTGQTATVGQGITAHTSLYYC
jgi:hypothetical protein